MILAASPARMRVLSLDGGGVRGAATLHVLLALEATIGARLANRADLIAGTSTGALIACGLGLGYRPGEILAHYRSLAGLVFGSGGGPGAFGPAHDARPLEQALAELFGARPMAELRPRTMVTLYDWRARRLRLAKSWLPQWAEIPIADVLRGAVAAPGYLRPHHHAGAQWIDGGVAANQPALCALAEARALGAELDQVHLVSVGTGAAPPAEAPSAAGWGLIGWAPHLVGVLLDGAAEAVDYQAAALLGDRYVRLQPALERDVPLDGARALPEIEGWALTWCDYDGADGIQRAGGLLA